MDKIFQSVQSSLKIDQVRIDNNVFRLHYKVTCLLLMVCSLLITSKQYIGDPIDCMFQGVSDKESKPYDTYCWIHTTFTVPRSYRGKVGDEVPHPGVSNVLEGEELKHHKYYQWVCFYLFFMAALFYLPRFLWKNWEGGRCKQLSDGLLKPLILDEEELSSQVDRLAQYLFHHRGHQKSYAFRFFFCEMLNMINVIGLLFLTDIFLGYEFFTYGSNVTSAILRPDEERVDPMAMVFPKVTKCTFNNYGFSGTVETKDAICVLSLNIINEKIFIFVYFWFMTVAIVTCLAMFYRILILVSWSARFALLKATASLVPDRDLDTVIYESDIGDWFMLKQLSLNLDPYAFKELIVHLAIICRTTVTK